MELWKDGLPQRREDDDVTHVTCFKLIRFCGQLMDLNVFSAGFMGRDGTKRDDTKCRPRRPDPGVSAEFLANLDRTFSMSNLFRISPLSYLLIGFSTILSPGAEHSAAGSLDTSSGPSLPELTRGKLSGPCLWKVLYLLMPPADGRHHRLRPPKPPTGHLREAFWFRLVPLLSRFQPFRRGLLFFPGGIWVRLRHGCLQSRLRLFSGLWISAIKPMISVVEDC